MFDLITIGDANLDTIVVLDEASLSCDLKQEHCQLCLNYADKVPIKQSEQSVGGNAANVSSGIAKLGLKVAIISELGNDVSGQTIQKKLKNDKVDTRFIKIIKKGETNYGVVLTYKGERTILSYHAKRHYSLPKLLPTKWVYYTSLGQSFENLQTKLMVYLKKNKTTKLAVNLGSFQLRDGLETAKQILPLTEILFANKEEAEIIEVNFHQTYLTVVDD